MAARTATISRQTSETSIEVTLDLDFNPASGAKQNIDISTGIGFLDHVRLRIHYSTTLFLKFNCEIDVQRSR